MGIDQVMRHPGHSNQVSNGTYPFRGLYKNVGPAGAAEKISEGFAHRAYFAAGLHASLVPKKGFQRGSVIGFAVPDRIEIVPDGERVVCLVKKNAQARRDWAWLVLPIRWGYPPPRSGISACGRCFAYGLWQQFCAGAVVQCWLESVGRYSRISSVFATYLHKSAPVMFGGTTSAIVWGI